MGITKEKDIIIDLIKNYEECEYLDFKQTPYTNNQLVSFLKDIVSFANSHCNKDKYIIFGVKDNSKKIIGIDAIDFMDASIYQRLLIEKVEPDIHIECNTFIYKNKTIGYIKILSSNNNRPYIIKLDYNNGKKQIRKGQSFIRKGSFNSEISRDDLDKIHTSGNFEIFFYDNFVIVKPIYISTINEDAPTYGCVEVRIHNFSERPVTIDKGFLEISLNNKVLTNHIVYGLGEPKGINFNNTFPINYEKVLPVYFNFLSDDCITLNLDDDGTADDRFSLRLILIDINNNEYIAELDECFLKAKGDVLHKIQLKYNIMRKYLKSNFKKLMKAIEKSDYKTIESIMQAREIDFALVKADHTLNNKAFPETFYIYECLKLIVKKNDQRLLNYFKKIGLEEKIILKAQGKLASKPLVQPQSWSTILEKEHQKFIESRRFE